MSRDFRRSSERQAGFTSQRHNFVKKTLFWAYENPVLRSGRVEPLVQLDVAAKEVVINGGVGGFRFDGLLDGDHGPPGLVEVSVGAGGDCGGHGRTQST